LPADDGQTKSNMSQFDTSDTSNARVSLFKIQSRQNQQYNSDTSNDSSGNNDDQQADDGSSTDDTGQAGASASSSPLDELKAFTTLALESLAQAAAGKNSEQFSPSTDTTPTPYIYIYGMCYMYVKMQLVYTCL
jgi:cobalamin biosynthesis Mg chelatase CobN